MKIVLFTLLFLLFPITTVFAQVTDTQSTLGVKLTNTAPFVYKDDEGYTVVIGEVENTKSFPVNNVKVWVGFFSGKAAGTAGETPLETVTGTSLLEVIPAKGKSPFIIKSETPDPEITEVTINVLGFNAATQKQQLLEVEPGALIIGETITLDAQITNTGANPAENIRAHLIGYDVFSPPRIVGIQTILLDDIASQKTGEVSFDTVMDNRASSFKIIVESDNSQSKMTNVDEISLESPTRLITINDVDVLDSDGERISKIKIGQTVDVSSNLSIFTASENPEQDYVYYVQVRQFGEKSQVEFLGFAEGKFDSTDSQVATVSWTPQSEGGFFIETYVWDLDAVALAAPSKTISVILVTP
ncbi:MAG: hypothetical protein FJ357_03255 [Thaumarchaeota archaeon]|nr:hypothetical protein [Nitrososphaerota archaeon]